MLEAGSSPWTALCHFRYWSVIYLPAPVVAHRPFNLAAGQALPRELGLEGANNVMPSALH